MSTEPEARPEIFLQHARGLRAVARGLLADDAAADDVVQETWRMALERPPRGGRGLGAWLREVARRTALKHRRGETRRSRREQTCARPERLASTVEVLAEREILRSVVDAVLTLSEPYQTALVLRFYEDLPPRAIARRTGVSVATVKSRIQRGLALARKDLDQSSGGRERWAPALIATIGWMPSATAVAVAHGGWSMQWKFLAVATSTGVVALCVTSWSAPTEPVASEGRVEEVEIRALAEGATVQPSDAAQVQDSARSAVAPPVDDVPWAHSHPLGRYELTLAGVVRETRDVALEAAHVFVATPLGPWNDVGEVDGEGRFEVTIRAHEPTQDVLVWANKGELRASGAQLVRLSNDATTFVTLRIETPLEWVSLMSQLDRMRAEVDALGPRANPGELVELEKRREVGMPVRLGVRPRFHFQDGRFQWPTLDSLRQGRLPGSKEVVAKLSQRRRQVEEKYERIDLGASRGLVLEDQTAGLEPREVAIAGRVVDAAGEPVAGTWLRTASDGEVLWSRAGADGTFELSVSIGANPIELRAGGQDDGLAFRTLATAGLEPGATIAWDPVLDRALELSGRIAFRADVEPALAASDWVVEYRSNAAEPWIDETDVDAGAFAIPNVPAGSGQLRLKLAGSAFPLFVVHDVGPSAGSLTLELEAADLRVGRLAVVAEGENGELESHPEVRVTQLDTGLSVSLGWTNGRFIERVPAGRYRVAVGDHERGFVDGGVVQVLANELAEVHVALGAPAHVDLAGVTGTTSGLVWALYQSDAVDTQVATGIVGQPFDDALPAGSYVLAIEAPNLSAARVAFDVVAGQTAEPEIAVDDLHELHFANVEPQAALSVVVLATGTELWQGALATSTARLAVPAGSYRVESLDSDALPAVEVTTSAVAPVVVRLAND